MEGPIKGLHVTSVVVSRFAKVVIESTMMNEMAEAKEMHFSVNLPNSAFITEFKMVVAGKTIYGEVKEKVKAEQQYKKAVRAGRSGGLIKAAVRETQRFHISTNVPAQSIVVFHLVYQELLQRKLGKYNHMILINPGQIVEKFLIETTIIENSGLTFLSANCGDEEKYPFSIEVIREKNLGKVKFEPSNDEQRKLLELPEVDRKIVACYDVTREVLGGEIQTRNGYFVHYFAPTCLPVLPKKVVFIIDRSGSMSGRKLAQTKDAFMSVIKELRDIDRFNIVTFDRKIDVWKYSWTDNNLLPAIKKNVDAAMEFVKCIKAGNSTNLNDALHEGSKLLGDVKIQDRVASMMIVLTDGRPDTDAFQIRSKIQEVTRGRFSIFTLGFGNDVNRTFLERLAEENDGIFRKIYQDSDADLQLKNFFNEVASPLLLHVKITYLGTSVMDVSRSTYDQYFYGSEIVIVGVMPEADAEFLKSSVAAITASGDISYEAISTRIQIPEEQIAFAEDFDNFIERIWAYFTVKDLLHKIDMADSEVNIRDVKSRALTLALKYRFVTSLTSMVVTDLDGQVSVEVTEDPDQICDANTYLKQTRSSALSIGNEDRIPMYGSGPSAPRHSRVDKEMEDFNMRDIQDSRVPRSPECAEESSSMPMCGNSRVDKELKVLTRTTADESLATTSKATELSITEKTNAIIMFNMSDNHFYSYKISTKEWSRMQKYHYFHNYKFTPVASGEHIYILQNQNVQQFEYSDPAAEWKEICSMCISHGYNPAAVVLNGFIYVCGSRYGEYQSIERYDASRNQWEQMCDMNTTEKHPCCPCVVATEDHIYYMGGRTQSVERFDARSNIWKIVESLPIPIRCGASAAIVKNRIYVAHGSEVLCYDIPKNKWSRINLTIQWPFSGFKSKILAVDDELYLIGIIDDDVKKFAIYLLKPETKQMTLVEEFEDKKIYIDACLAVNL